MDILLLYLFTRIDAIRGLFQGVFIISATMLAINIFIVVNEIKEERIERFTRKARWIFPLFLFLAVFTPGQKDIALIVGGHYTLEAAQSETAKKVYSIIQNELDKQLEQIKKRKE